MEDDRGPRLLVVCCMLVALAGLFLGLRIYCKVIRQKGIWWDDWVMMAAWIALLAAGCFNARLVSLGFGRHMNTISEHNRDIIGFQTVFVGMFSILALSLSKTSFCLTLLRLLVDSRMSWLLWFIIVTVNVGLNMVWIIGFVKCSPMSKAWEPTVEGHCWPKAAVMQYGFFAGYYSAALDVLLALLPWKILMGMAMLRRERLGVAVCMSLGIIAGVAGFIKNLKFASMASPDITYERVDLTIWGMAEGAVSIMAASLPVLRILFRQVASGSRRYWKAMRRQSESLVNGHHLSFSTPRGSKGSGATAAPPASHLRHERSQDALFDDLELGVSPPAPPPSVHIRITHSASDWTPTSSTVSREANIEMQRLRTR